MPRESFSQKHLLNCNSDTFAPAAGFRTVFREATDDVHHTDTICAHTGVPYAANIA